MAFTLNSLTNNLSAVVKDVGGQGGLLDNLSTDLASGNDFTGISDSIADGGTLLGNIFGRNGVVEDLFSDSNQTGKVLDDLFDNGGVVNNLANYDDPLGADHLLNGGTLLGNVAGNGGVTDDALTLVFFG